MFIQPAHLSGIIMICITIHILYKMAILRTKATSLSLGGITSYEVDCTTGGGNTKKEKKRRYDKEQWYAETCQERYSLTYNLVFYRDWSNVY